MENNYSLRPEIWSVNEHNDLIIKDEFKRNQSVNYIVRCLVVLDGEEFHILDNQEPITSELIPESVLAEINRRIEAARILYDSLNRNYGIEIRTILLEAIEIVKPYISFPNMYKNDFGTWEAFVCEDWDNIKYLGD